MSEIRERKWLGIIQALGRYVLGTLSLVRMIIEFGAALLGERLTRWRLISDIRVLRRGLTGREGEHSVIDDGGTCLLGLPLERRWWGMLMMLGMHGKGGC